MCTYDQQHEYQTQVDYVEKMTLTVNGNKTEIDEGTSIAGLLKNLDIEPARVAVEVNLSIIRKCDFQEHILMDGDKVEVVNFVGGG